MRGLLDQALPDDLHQKAKLYAGQAAKLSSSSFVGNLGQAKLCLGASCCCPAGSAKDVAWQWRLCFSLVLNICIICGRRSTLADSG
jgi:hypothetical protein